MDWLFYFAFSSVLIEPILYSAIYLFCSCYKFIPFILYANQSKVLFYFWIYILRDKKNKEKREIMFQCMKALLQVLILVPYASNSGIGYPPEIFFLTEPEPVHTGFVASGLSGFSVDSGCRREVIKWAISSEDRIWRGFFSIHKQDKCVSKVK